MLEHEPLSDDERVELQEGENPRAKLDRVWDDLPTTVQEGIAELAFRIVNPSAHSLRPNSVGSRSAI